VIRSVPVCAPAGAGAAPRAMRIRQLSKRMPDRGPRILRMLRKDIQQSGHDEPGRARPVRFAFGGTATEECEVILMKRRAFGAVVVAAGVVVLASCSSGDKSDPSAVSPPTSSKSQSSSETTIETPAYRLRAPAGVTNEATTKAERGSIVLNYRRPYGLVSVEVFSSTLDLSGAQVTRNCTTVESVAKVSGTKATRYDGDCSKVVSGPSTKDLIRSTIDFEKIPKPSEEKYTVVSIDLLSTQDVPTAGITAFKAEAQATIDSLVIK